ncbi:phage integrase family site specific recombinase [Brucella sp. 191011898]|nr:phage integrase family site specific recombinase [Brucella sp. 191011898]
MGLPMPAPYKYPKTGVYYLRQRVPADLKDKARGKIVAIPISGTLKSFTVGDSVKASLETKDPATPRRVTAKLMRRCRSSGRPCGTGR